jgi:hypothetical protein
MQSLNMNPIIRPGNHLIQLINGDYYIGNSHKGFCFNEVERYRFLQHCDGKRSLAEISKIIGTELSLINLFLQAGLTSKYLINISQPQTFNKINSGVNTFGSTSNLGFNKLKTRRDCDYDFYLKRDDSIHKEEIVDSMAVDVQAKAASTDLFINRAGKEILIFGSNQFTVQLFAALQSVGFSKSRVIGSFGKDQLQLCADDIAGGVIQSSDVGSTISQISNRISREHQLVNSEYQRQVAISQPSLIIAMQPVPADYQQRWLSESTPYFVVGSVIENQIEIGPIVLPGKTTCLRCKDLTLVANALSPEIASIDYLNGAERLPSGVLSLTVGLVTLFATQFLDQECDIASPLISSALRIDLANPCKQSHIKWQPHPMCGCGADLAQYANGAKG